MQTVFKHNSNNIENSKLEICKNLKQYSNIIFTVLILFKYLFFFYCLNNVLLLLVNFVNFG